MSHSWRKASASGAGNDCVETNIGIKVGSIRVGGLVRDSKNPAATLAVDVSMLVAWIRTC
jgi:hypothetical protein